MKAPQQRKNAATGPLPPQPPAPPPPPPPGAPPLLPGRPPSIARAATPVARLMLRDWKRVLLTTVAVTAIAWSLAAMQPRRYRASVLASVGPLTETLEPNELLRSVEVLERRTVVGTVAALATTPATRARVAVASGYRVEPAVLPNTNLFRVDVEGENAAQTAAIANRFPDVLNAQTRAMYKYYGVSMISPAATPDAPFSPRTGRAIAAGFAIGLFLGLLAAFAPAWRAAHRA
ncbi:MAG TPA: hypothetical protein VF266_04305 [Thermoanaerobaculia bacterium]